LIIIFQFLRWLLLAVEIVFACPVLYLCVVSFSAILAKRKRAIEAKRVENQSDAQKTFAILIPAHNEEVILHKLLESLSQLAYPKELYSVYVIADNCTDKTAALARQFEGVQVYERFNQEKRGKGYALNWMLQQLEDSQRVYDAYIVLDADSVVIPEFLQAFDREMVRGAKALQACNTVLNITESPSTALRWVALTLMNHVRPLGRNGLGCSSTLTGNGMCLSHEILQRYPWQAFGIAEDYQYYLTLVQDGVRVSYVPEAIVRSQMPVTFEQMRTQDVRWEAGAPQQSQWRIALQLLSVGLRKRCIVRLEAVAELLTPPLSLLVVSCMLLFAVSLLLFSPLQIIVSLLLLVGVAYYVATALYLLRAPSAVYKALLHAPGFVLWKLWVFFILRRSRKHTKEWVRTTRTAS
jgi:cellulose synthase/poly-beta-1,6-N-acetylglucosamine synthase-like glycosyltransferase